MESKFYFETTYQKNPNEVWEIWLHQSLLKWWFVSLYIIAFISSVYATTYGTDWSYWAGILCLALLIMYPTITIFQMYRACKNDPTVKYPTRLTVNELGVNVYSPIREISHGWEFFTHWENIKGNIVLVDARTKQNVIIPNRAFSASHMMELLENIRQLLPQKK